MMKKTAWALASAALLSLGLTGCANFKQEATEEAPAEQVTESKDATTAPQLCLVPNNNVQDPAILALLGEGLKLSGFDVKPVTSQAEFEACKQCFTFQLQQNEKTKLIESIALITFHGNQPDLTATGAAMPEGKFTQEMLVKYGYEFGQQILKVLNGEPVTLPKSAKEVAK